MNLSARERELLLSIVSAESPELKALRKRLAEPDAKDRIWGAIQEISERAGKARRSDIVIVVENWRVVLQTPARPRVGDIIHRQAWTTTQLLEKGAVDEGLEAFFRTIALP